MSEAESAGTMPETIALTGRSGDGQAVLTRIEEDDGDSFAAAVAASYDHLAPWMPWIGPDAVDPARQRERCRIAGELWDANSDYMYALRPSPGGPVIGTFGLHRRVGPRAIEIGYWMHVDHVRRGHASTAARAITAAAFAHAGVDRVEIHTDEANVASAAVPHALGYRLDRVDVRPSQAPGESGRLQIWVTP